MSTGPERRPAIEKLGTAQEVSSGI